MRMLKQALGVLGALVVFAVIVAFVSPNRARGDAGADCPGQHHPRRRAQTRLVSLQCFDGKAYCSEINPEGNVDQSTAYVVPAGYTLIVTDYEWQSTASQGPGLVDDFLSNPKAGLLNASEAEPNQFGQAYADVHYATGFRVSSGVTLADSLAGSSTGASLVQGYLVPND